MITSASGSIEQYEPTGFSLQIFKDRYAFTEKEAWSEACRRVSRIVAACENNGKKEEWENKFYKEIVSNRFTPGGRVWYGAGRPKSNLVNCFVLGTGDSREAWGKTASDVIRVSGVGGGVGINFSSIRPRGTPIIGTGGVASGAVSFMKIINAIAEEIKSGGGRRSAHMQLLDLCHGDIEEFLDAKIDKKELNNANISVSFGCISPEEFFDLVDKDKDLSLTWRGTEIRKIKAKKLWSKIIDNAYESGEPGLFNHSFANEMNNVHYYKEIAGTNPCITGDTKVALADGRFEKTIKELAEEGKDVPVFCFDDNGKVKIRVMRNPRITGYNVPIFKVNLDDGSSFRTTKNHKIRLSDGSYKEVKDLIANDSIKIMTRYEASIKDIFGDHRSNCTNYWWINSGFKSNLCEHKMIAGHFYNCKIGEGFVVHHKNRCGTNNLPENLEVMTKEEHDLIHGEMMRGDRNPMRRAKTEWSEEKWQQYHDNMSKAESGERNGNYSGFTDEQLKEHAILLTRKLNRPFSNGEWIEYARENGLPFAFVEWRQQQFGGINGLKRYAAITCGFENIAHFQASKQRHFLNLLSEGYDCEIINDRIVFNKKCEICNKDFQTTNRECSVCSTSCASSLSFKRHGDEIRARKRYARDKNKIKQIEIYNELRKSIQRDPQAKEFIQECKNQGAVYRTYQTWSSFKSDAENYNHKVVSVEFDGYENVYNGTVDEFHNFFIGGFESKTKNEKRKLVYVNNLQCGETVLSEAGSCVLGSIVLHRFVNEESKKIEWDKLDYTVRVGTRFLDNVVSVTAYPLREIEEESINTRRIGLGVTGFHDMLLKLGIKYDSKEAVEIAEKVFSFVCNKSYETSTYIAVEKGVFPVYDREQIMKSGFIKTLKSSTRMRIKEYGLRNAALLSCPPTGTVSIISGNCSSGIEPIFGPAYKRKYYDIRNNNKMKEEIVFHPLFDQYMREGKDVSFFECVDDISVRSHFEMQRTCQKYIDQAISKTIIIDKKKVSKKEIEKLIRDFLPVLKGLTIYPIDSRAEQPISPLDLSESKRLWKENEKHNTEGEQSKGSCKNGVCEL